MSLSRLQHMPTIDVPTAVATSRGFRSHVILDTVGVYVLKYRTLENVPL